MPLHLKTGVKATGLAALIAAAPLAYGADEVPVTLDWSAGSTWSQGDQFSISLSGFVEGYAFYFDPDDEWSRDLVLRAGTTKLATATKILTDANLAVADGIEVDDAELYLTGEAYGTLIFGLGLEAAGGTAELDDWYIGVQNIPGIGTAQFGYFAGTSYIGVGSQLDDDIIDWVESQDQVGLFFYNEFYDGKLGYEFGVGLNDTLGGKKDGNYSLHGSIYGIPFANDDHSIMLMLNAQIINPDTTGHNKTTATWGASSAPVKGPELVAVTATNVDTVTNLVLSGDWVMGAFNLGGVIGLTETEVYSGGNFDQAFIDIITGANGSPTVIEYLDGDATVGSIYASYTITGEAQNHGGGISSPAAPFAWDGSGWGALDVVARFTVADLMTDVQNGYTFSTDPIVTAQSQALNREEGADATEMIIGVNWYLSDNVSFGAYISRWSFEYDSGAITGMEGGIDDMGNFVYATGAAAPTADFASLAAYSQLSQISNDYDVDAFHFRASASF